MCGINERNLSLNGETFAIMKDQFDKILNSTIGNMEMKGTDEAVITLKLVVGLEKSSVNIGGTIKDVTKPTFKHDISSVMQVKNKVSGQTNDDYALVWDDSENKYVLRKIDNGQMSFDDLDSKRYPVYDAEYREVKEIEDQRGLPEGATANEGDDQGEDTPNENEAVSGDLLENGEDDSDEGDTSTPYGWLKQFAGESMYVVEADGNYTVRDENNRVILSSAASLDSPFYCSAEKLAEHLDHDLICVTGVNDDDGGGYEEYVKITCADCGYALFVLTRTGRADDEEDGYEYEAPEEE